VTDKQRTRLQAAVDILTNLRSNNVDDKTIVALLVRDHDARLHTQAWTNTLRFGGHTASCTASADQGLLANWSKSAALKLIGAVQGGFGAER
jgi:hypothetical protein